MMAYTAKDAVQTFLNYIDIKEEDVQFITNTSNRGLILDVDDEQVVIFVYPISHKADDSKNFFDTRDSGARERGETWEYALKKGLKYFCIAVNSDVNRYKDYIFSLEANEVIVAAVSGTLEGKRNGPGTQVVIPNDFAPHDNIERIKTKNNFYITAVKKETFFNYIKVFDNRPYTHEYDLLTLENISSSALDYTEKDLLEEFTRFLENIGKHKKNTVRNYVYALRGTLFNEVKEDIESIKDIDIYSISSKDELSRIIELLDNSIKYKEKNEDSHFQMSAALAKYSEFLEWRSKQQSLDWSDKTNQRIFFGAPGTGKSYSLNKEAIDLVSNNQEQIERVTFHPDYTYANFVGSYKPIMKSLDDDSEDRIAYEYVPGPFMRTLVKALKNPNKPYVLIVEEINRANVVAVFGDVFQLLDRKEDGTSEYNITTSDDMRAYLAQEGVDIIHLTLPSNMFIWATMNSADQGVYPMDTAFKRRWSFKYIGIDDEEGKLDDNAKTPKFTLGNGKTFVSWNDLRKAINNELSSDSYNINEDKLMGPFFLASSVLENQDTFVEAFKNKVLMYLFDDVVKQKRRQFFKGHSRYSEICKAFDIEGINIFPDSVSNSVKQAIRENEHEEAEA